MWTRVAQQLRRLAAALLLGTAPAYASGGQAPTPPSVDFSSVADSASERPVGIDGKPHQVHARLLTDKSTVAPGDRFRIGLHLEQDPEWHTYWKTPGSIGKPTEISWDAPDGVWISEHTYPVPLQFPGDGTDVSYGYDDQVLLISDVEIPDEIDGDTLTISASANWLVCKTSCIPGRVQLSTTLSVADAATASPFVPLFDHFAAQHPKQGTDVDAIDITATFDKSGVVPNGTFDAAIQVRAKPGYHFEIPENTLWPTVAPISRGLDWTLAFDNPVAIKATDDGFIVTFKGETFQPIELPEDDAIGALFQLDIDGERIAFEHTVPVPWVDEDTDVSAVVHPIWDALGRSPAATATPKSTASAGTPAADTPAVAAGPDTAPTRSFGLGDLLANLLPAFLGGLILNVMPCVLPVLSLKLYGLVEQGGVSHAERRSAGLAYTGGILVSFWALAAAVFAARMLLAGDVGWGFQMQYPGYVAGLATAMFVFALNLFGVFEIPAVGAGTAYELGSRDGAAGHFFTGVFATLVATPCSAPFLGTAAAFAFQAPPWMLVLIFSMVGLGLAAPFLLIAFLPSAQRLMPKPGPWMETFKQLLGFSLVATTVWLTGVLAAQVGLDGAVGFLWFLSAVALAAWAFGRWGGIGETGTRQLVALGLGVAFSAFAGSQLLDLSLAHDADCDDGSLSLDLQFQEHVPWQPFSEERIASAADHTVFIDFTADWCVTCKFNERTILETTAVREKMSDCGVIPLKGDWTRQDPRITEWLGRFDRAGVPLYVIIPPNGEPVALPEVITTRMVIDALEQATGPGQCG